MFLNCQAPLNGLKAEGVFSFTRFFRAFLLRFHASPSSRPERGINGPLALCEHLCYNIIGGRNFAPYNQKHRGNNKVKQQFIPIRSWMLELGLTPAELLTFAVIVAYNEYKGFFEGEDRFLAKWSATESGRVAAVLEQLTARGLIRSFRNRYGKTCYKVNVIGVSPAHKTAAGEVHAGHADTTDPIDPIEKRDINSIDTIDSMDSIDNKDIGSIDAIDSIDKKDIDTIDSIEASDGSVKSRSEKKAAGGSPGGGKRNLTPEEIRELIYPYESIELVPLKELAARIDEFERKGWFAERGFGQEK